MAKIRIPCEFACYGCRRDAAMLVRQLNVPDEFYCRSHTEWRHGHRDMDGSKAPMDFSDEEDAILVGPLCDSAAAGHDCLAPTVVRIWIGDVMNLCAEHAAFHGIILPFGEDGP